MQTHLLLHSCTCGIQRGLGPVQALFGSNNCLLCRHVGVRCADRLQAWRNTWCGVTLSINLTRWRLHVTAAVPAAPCRGVLPRPGGRRVISGKLHFHLFTRLEPVMLGRRATAWQEHAQRLWDSEEKLSAGNPGTCNPVRRTARYQLYVASGLPVVIHRS